MVSKLDYTAVVEQKRTQRDSKIPKEWKIKDYSSQECVINVPQTCGLLSERELEITGEGDAVDLLQKIREKKYTAEEVTRAFCKRAAIAQQLTNCLTEIFFDDAIARAKELDQDVTDGMPMGPLHGLPISLKDNFRVPGVDASMGFVCLVNDPDKTHSALPKLLHDLGAVFYCKTNLPQTSMTGDSENNVFGRTLNPWNKALTAGGSSGGEGALIALRGSVLGIATDIAGSIRMPSLANGIYGFKPSANVIPFVGDRIPVAAGEPGIIPAPGPMATSLRACSFLVKTIMEAEPWRYDAACAHLYWRDLPLPGSGLKIGVVTEDGVHTPWPPMRRALSQACGKLSRAGAEIRAVQLPDVKSVLQTLGGFFALDGGLFIGDLIARGNEPLVESVKRLGLKPGTPASVDQLRALNVARTKHAQAFQDIWSKHRLDAIIMPVAPHCATKHDTWDSIAYTAVWNLVDNPAVSIPYSAVEEEDVADGIETATHGEQDRVNYARYTAADDFLGAPLAVQVVGQKQEDEKLTLIAQFVDKVLHS